LVFHSLTIQFFITTCHTFPTLLGEGSNELTRLVELTKSICNCSLCVCVCVCVCVLEVGMIPKEKVIVKMAKAPKRYPLD
jgi:hypothetical protein